VDTQEALQLEQDGKREEALAAYVDLGLLKDGARVAWLLGRARESGDLSLRAGLFYEAALCFMHAQDPEAALSALSRMPQEDPRYREACLHAVSMAQATARLDIRLDTFLARWLRDAPQDEREAESLYGLADLYERMGMREPARAAFQRVQAHFPDLRDVGRRLTTLLDIPASVVGGDAILAEERAYRNRRRGRTAELPVPPPPGADRTQQMTAVPTRAPAPSGMRAVVEPGIIVAERYHLVRKLGQGGMAVVFEAMDLELQQKVALKVFTQLFEGQEMEVRFRREVAISRGLAHPNVVRVFDLGKLQGHKYMIMELLDGGDLQQYLDERPTVNLRGALEYLLQMCAGLGAAHAHGVVHRDVKPGNFFITRGGVVKLMDFGIARDMKSPSVTPAGVVMGTPEYMAPEQFHGFNRVTPASDLYALGVVAYQLLTGTLPFRTEDAAQLALMHARRLPEPLQTHNPAVPEALDLVVLKLLEKEPRRRPEDAASVAATVKQLLDATGPGWA
jgi:serine/threonine-protein kinase